MLQKLYNSKFHKFDQPQRQFRRSWFDLFVTVENVINTTRTINKKILPVNVSSHNTYIFAVK